MTKDEWIAEAKGLLSKHIGDIASPPLRAEARLYIKEEELNDLWIQEVKGLLFDAIYTIDSYFVKKKFTKLLERGGGYDIFKGEHPGSPLIFPEE